MYDTGRWCVAFLVAPMKIPYEERMYLITVAAEMYLNHERQRKFTRPTYAGVIETDGKHGLLGCFTGQRFTGIVETLKGEDKLSFLIAEHMDHRMN